MKAFFFVGLLLLGAILVRRDLFLNPSERSNKQDIQPRMPKKEHCAPVCDFSKAEHLDLRGTTNVWNVCLSPVSAQLSPALLLCCSLFFLAFSLMIVLLILLSDLTNICTSSSRYRPRLRFTVFSL